MSLIDKFCFFLFFTYFVNFNEAYRILVISPFISKSHNSMLESVAKALAIKGHQVDVISHYKLENPPKNYKTIINLDGTMPKNVNTLKFDTVEFYRSVDLVPLVVSDNGNNFCDLMALEEMQKLIKNPPNDPAYDLVITEALAANCYIGFGHVLKVPVILVSALIEFPWFNEILGNPMSNAYAINWETKNFRVNTFWERVKNHFWVHYHNYRFFKYSEAYQTAVMRKYLDPNIPSIREIEKKASLLLVNAHYSVYGVKPVVPSIVQIGGLQIELNDAKMTPELKTWMDESIHGVVFFTLGSMVLIEEFPEDVLAAVYASLANLAPIRVLMKVVHKEKLPPGLPKNVLTMKWIPQVPVLRHNNTKLFMTHGGLNSVHEALYYGVPMIGFPLFGDQPLNIRLLWEKNVVYEMDYKEISEKSLDKALKAVLSDSKYRDAAKRVSHLFRDRPMNARDTAIFWVEYIIRNGENALRSPSMDMPWWRAELVDVYLFFFTSLLLIVASTLFILLKIICLLKKIINSNSSKKRRKED